jgi:6-pyruvoyltetrahydropterin/6-carboxytetrahydropterin synthase
VPRYRICKSFTVESGHMLSKHPERCRFPHGHTRRIEVVVSSERLDANDMVLDFKVLRLALEDHIERYDHSMALNGDDPILKEMERIYPGSTIAFDGIDPTTEAIAKEIFDYTAKILREGFEATANSGVTYRIPAGATRVERIRVWETPTSWAEYGD